MNVSQSARLVAVTLLLAAATPAIAVPVSYSFTGTAGMMSWANGVPRPFEGNSPFGHTGSGSLTFDFDFSRVAFSNDQSFLAFSTSSAFGSFSLEMPTFPWVGNADSAGSDCNQPSSYLRMADAEPGAATPMTELPADQFTIFLSCNREIASGVTANQYFYLDLMDWDASLDTVTGLDPAQTLNWTSAGSAQFVYGYALFDENCVSCESGMRESWSVGFRLTDLSSRAVGVPEPGTAALLALGLPLCGLMRRRRLSRLTTRV